MAIETKQYETLGEFSDAVKASPNIVNADDQQRCKAYEVYEDIYYNRPETLKVTIRGDDEDGTEIYMPSGKKIIDSVSRFLGVEFDFVVDPTQGDDLERGDLTRLTKNLFRREKMYTKWVSQKRNLLIRGDALWHITADPNKPEGKRVSIHELHPKNYFPIEDPDDKNRLLGCYIVDLVQDPRAKDDKTKKVARRQAYRKTQDDEGVFTGEITSEIILFEIGTWDDRTLEPGDIKQVKVIKPAEPLPEEITQIPVYHWRNNGLTDSTFGLSECSGLETLIRGINQAITDEDIVIVTQGLGMYVTTAGPPEDANGNATPWNLGPKQVIELGEEQEFSRVTGVSSVSPFQEHIKMMDESMCQAAGVNDIAAGKVDVTVAESGISLKLQMLPLIMKNQEKELEMLSIFDQLLYDLQTMWFAAFEDLNSELAEVATVVGDPMPENRDAMIQEVLLLFTSGLITIETAQAKLSKYGYDFEDGDAEKIIKQQRALALARNGDPFDNRAQEELENEPGPSGAKSTAVPPDQGSVDGIPGQTVGLS